MGKFTFVTMGAAAKIWTRQVASVSIPAGGTFTPTVRGLYRIANMSGYDKIRIQLYDGASVLWRNGNFLDKNLTFITDGANLRLWNTDTVSGYTLYGLMRFDLESTKTEGTIPAAGTLILPKGFLSYVSEADVVYPEVFNGSIWHDYQEIGAWRATNFLISDGVNARIRNVDTTLARRYVYILGV